MDFKARDMGDHLRSYGIDWGYNCPHGPFVVHRSGDFVVYKVPGYTGWCAVGMQKYHGTTYTLARLDALGTHDKEKRPWMQVVTIEEVKPGRKWQSVLKDLKAKADKRAEERQ